MRYDLSHPWGHSKETYCTDEQCATNSQFAGKAKRVSCPWAELKNTLRFTTALIAHYRIIMRVVTIYLFS